jgi:hypothetical protein
MTTLPAWSKFNPKTDDSKKGKNKKLPESKHENIKKTKTYLFFRTNKSHQ